MAIDGNVLDSFFVALGFKVDDEGIKKFQTSFEKLRETALHFAEALSLPAIGLFVESVAKSLGEMQHFAQVNHISTDQLQAFNAIARANHIEVDAMDQGIAELNKRLGQAQLGTGRLLPILKKLGIGLKDTHGHARDVNSILGAVADKMKKLTPAQNLGLGARLGLDPGMILLLQKGGDNWRKTFAEAQKNVAFTPEQLERAEKTDLLFVKFWHHLEVLKDFIALKLMPTVDRLLDRFDKWVTAMSADPTSTLNRSLRALGVIADFVGDHLSLLANIALPLLAFWFGRVATEALIAFGRMAIGAAISIGSMIEQLAALSIAEIIALAPIWLWVAAFAAVVAIGYEVYKHWDKILGWFGHALNWIFEKVEKLGAAIGHLVGWGGEKLRKLGSAVGGKDGKSVMSEETLRVLHESETARGTTPAWAAPHGNAWISSNHRSQTIVQHVTGTQIHVHSPDPEKAGEKVKEALRDDTHRRLIRNSQGSHF